MWRKSIASLLLLVLFGCGGEGDNASTATGNGNGNVLAPLVRDTFNQLSIADGQTQVSLKESVDDPQGLPVTLESVTVSHSDCPAPTSINREQLSFTVEANGPDMCFYDYTVKNHPKEIEHAKSASAQSNVMINLTSAPAKLPPQSETTNVDQSIPIEVRSKFTTGYTLDSEVVVIGEGFASGNSENDVITYTPGSQGVTRLVYTMTNADGSALLVGTVDVAVSGLGNHAPVATNASFKMEFDESPKTFNLSDYVTDDDDGDEIQLLQVEAWDAEVGFEAQDDFDNLSFTFKPDHAGFHYVTYVVTDHNGGYGVAQVEIEVVDLSAVATWGNIQMGLKLFLGPLTSSEAESQEVTSTSSHYDNGFTVATFNLAAAEDSCQNKGRLPTSDELKALANYNGGPDFYDGWPVALPYWAKDDDGIGRLIDLSSGLPEVATSNTGYYVSCMNEAGLVVVNAESKLEAVADDVDQAVVAVKLTRDNKPVQGEWLEASVSNRTNVTFDDTTLSTDDKGVAKFALKTWEAGQVPVNIKSDGETVLTKNVKFIGNEATADLELEVIKDGAEYGNIGGNVVEATLMDAYDNPVVGRPVTFTTSEDQSVKRIGATATNTFGKHRVGFVWEDSSTTDASRTLTVTASYTPQSTENQLFDTAEITFVSPNPTDPPTDPLSDPLACGGINDTDPTNASGECVKVGTDYYGNWFTGSPSVALLKSLGYTIDTSVNNTGDTYHSTHREDGTYGPVGEFALFSSDGLGVPHPPAEGAGIGAQHDRWCQKLNELEFFGRTDWSVPTSFEIDTLAQELNNSPSRGWPLGYSYWKNTVTHNSLIYCGFSTGGIGGLNSRGTGKVAERCYAYTTCWSPKP